MTKLLIADDESYIRHGIRYAIPWHEHSIEVVGEAATGKEALEFCRHSPPDIVLTDIKMPDINGLELAKILTEQMPRIKVVILTAYSEPDFFLSAIESKVNSFVLKSASSDQILAAVLKAQKQFLDETLERDTQRRLQAVYNENQIDLIELGLRQLLSGEITPRLFESKMRNMSFSLSRDNYTIMVSELSAGAHETDADVLNRLRGLLSRYEPFILTDKSRYLIVILGSDTDAAAGEGDDAADGGCVAGLLDEVARLLGDITVANHITVTVGINKIEEFPARYRGLTDAQRFCFWNRAIPYYIVSSDYSLYIPDSTAISESEKDTLSSFLTNDAGKIEKDILRHYYVLKNMCVPAERFTESMNLLFALLLAKYAGGKPGNENISDLIKNITYPEEAIALFDRVFFSQRKECVDGRILSKALAFIGENYARDLRLADISKLVYLSEGYLSRIFKTETGFSFKEYLNKTRIEKAKALVTDTDLKYYEISAMVGYGNYKYFSQYFLKYTGQSAKEYRLKSRR